MKKMLFLILLISIAGCAPTYLAPINSSTATINISHTGQHPSSTSIDIFSAPKCEKQFYLGELADIGTNIDLKKSATGKVEANKVMYFSGTKDWPIPNTSLISSCSIMFSFTPKENATYSMKIDGAGSERCSIDVKEETKKETPPDLEIYKVNRICVGDIIHYEK